MDFYILLAFGIYFCCLVFVGIYFSSHTKNSHEFMLGNRSINYWVTAIATQASDMSSFLFLGFPGLIYTQGVSGLWLPIGLVTGMFCAWHYIAPSLRIATEKYNSLTLSSFFEARYEDKTDMIRLISACMTLLFFVFYIASGLVGMGNLFQTAFKIPYKTGAFLGIVSATLYTLIGGFVAVAWCDFFQGMFLLFMILLVPLMGFLHLGSLQPIFHTIQTHHLSLNFASNWHELYAGILLALGWGLGYFGQPHILMNFMGINDPSKLHAAKRLGISWQITALLAATAIGFVAMGYFPYPVDKSELIFIYLSQDLFPSLITGFALCGILAATLSTMDSHILISGSVIAQDLYKHWFKSEANSQTLVLISRIGSLCVATIAFFIALDNSSTVYNLVNYAWSGLGASFGPALIGALFIPWINRQGALASIIVGGITAALIPYELPLIPGFFASFVAMTTVSWITQKYN